MSEPTIRPAVAAELPLLRDIERAAGELFRTIGMDHVADDEPMSAEALEAYRADSRAWVLTGEDGRLAAYVLVDVVDGAAHVEQVTVHPDHARHGLGRRLLEHVASWAADQGRRALTLTTFRDVPWNGPYYERCGYRVLDDTERGPELAALMAAEAAHGLDPALRVAMRRDLT